MWYQRFYQPRSSPTADFKQLWNTDLKCSYSFLSYKIGCSCFPAESNGFGYSKSETSQILSTSRKHWAPWVTGFLWDSQFGHKTEWKLQQGHYLPGIKSWHPGGLIVPCKSSTCDLGSLSFCILIQPCVSFVSPHNSLDVPRGLSVTPIHLSFLSSLTNASAVLHQHNNLFQWKPCLWRPGWFTALLSIPLFSDSVLPACSIAELSPVFLPS